MWWDWVKTSKDLEAMTWVEFHGLFISKYFPATARHTKAQEFLELRQGTMTVMEYVARFTELARFADDYVATDMAKVRIFENGLKLSIRGKIVGLCLQDMDSLVRTALAMEREMEDARGIRDASAGGKRNAEAFCPMSSLGTGPARANDMLLLPSTWTYEAGVQMEAWMPGFQAGTIPIINGIGADTVCSFST